MNGIAFILDLAIVSLVAGIVGLACRRLQLSTVVGFLLAGIIIGPHTPPFQLVQDAERIRMLADLGLVFLVFGIGLSFSIRRMQRLGPGLVVATALAALLVLAAVRVGASLLGFSTQQGLFIAAVLMVSSSAIISKVLEETGANHTRWGQLALGVTLLEDIVAVVMLTLLSSIAALGTASPASGGDEPIMRILVSFTGFVAVFFLVVLLAVPRLLRHLRRVASSELLMLLTTGLLLALGWVAVRLGYSMALTAFLLGAIIGSTPHRPEVDRLFEGMRHLFGAVFFVAMGMMFDVSRVGEFWKPMLALAALALLLRAPAVVAGLLLTGTGLRDSLRASFALTPLGEFSFVIAFLGVQAGVMPDAFYPAAVGASLLTCLLSPVLIRRAEPAGAAVEDAVPPRLLDLLVAWQHVLQRFHEASARSATWRAIAPAATRAIVLLLVVAGCLALSAPAYRLSIGAYGADLFFPSGTTVLFLAATGAIVLAPLLAAWRALSVVTAALAGIAGGTLGMLLRRGLLIGLCVLSGIWLLAVVPAEAVSAPFFTAVVVGLLVLMALLWRNLTRWHEEMECRISSVLSEGESADGPQLWSLQTTAAEADWGLAVHELTLPPNTRHAGRQILDTRLPSDHGCTIVGIDRQGFALNNPSATERLFPGDRLLLLGRAQALPAAITFLLEGDDRPEWSQQFDDLATECVTIPPGSSCLHRPLRDLDLPGRHGLQVASIRRADGAHIANPGADDTLHPGDQLLLLGTHQSIRRFTEAFHPALLP